MKVTKVHTIISILSFAALAIGLVVRDTWVSFALIVACLLIALALLGGNISHLANIAEDNPKVKTIKFVTVFNAVCFLGVVAIIILSITGTIQLTDSSETMIASAITSLVILVLGNLCPKLPYSRHLADESTWILAHRILGYTAIPFGISNIIAMFSFQAPNIREGFAIGTFLLWVAIPSVISAIYFYKKRGSSY